MEQNKEPHKQYFAVLLVSLVTLLTYGLLIPWLGFYRDDWYVILAGQGQGTQGIIALFQSDRPFIGYLYALNYYLLGISPLGWHLLALTVRLAAGLAFLWLTNLLWPQRKTECALLTLLYVVYPGFLEQPIAATYINLLMAVAASVLSFALTARALRAHRISSAIVLTLIAFVLTLFYLAIFESMIGLEAARLVLIMYLLMQIPGMTWRTAFKRMVLWAWPYLLAAVSFLTWRLFLFKATRHSTDLDALLSEYAVSPLRAGLTILIELGKDFFETVFSSWVVPLYQLTVNGKYPDLALALLVAGLVVGLAFYSLRRIGPALAETAEFPPSAIWLGGIITILALFPINLAGRTISFSGHWDRYTLHAAIGCVLLAGGLVFKFVRKPAQTPFLLALVAIGVVTQVHNAAYYRDFWNYQRALWWQTTWRVPDFKERTLIYASLPRNFGYFEDYEIYAPANLIYTPDAQVNLTADLVNGQTMPYLINQQVKGKTNRGVYVHKNYKNAILLTIPTADSCVHVIDGRQVELPAFENGTLLSIAAFSKIERVDLAASPLIPPVKIFGESPRIDWCFYYQKITLARQRGNWELAANLADEALQKGFQPRDYSEWLPVFEAYVNSGDLEAADRLAPKMLKNREMIVIFCSQLTKRNDLPASYNVEYIRAALCQPSE